MSMWPSELVAAPLARQLLFRASQSLELARHEEPGSTDVSSIELRVPQCRRIHGRRSPINKLRGVMRALAHDPAVLDKLPTSRPCANKRGRRSTWPRHVRPSHAIAHFCNTSEAFTRLVEQAVAARPGVWNLIHYEDRYTLGDIVGADNKRKACRIYMSVGELGLAPLRHVSVRVPCYFIR